MRKIFAILLLAVLTFNLVGYRFLFTYMERDAQAAMAASLDAHAYTSSDLVEVKLPLCMPYIANSVSFERYDGSMEVNGVCYNYVDREVENDTLILHCIRNSRASNLSIAQNEYGKINNTQNATNGKADQASLLMSILLLASISQNVSYHFSNSTIACSYCFPKNNNAVINVFIASAEQPPEAV